MLSDPAPNLPVVPPRLALDASRAVPLDPSQRAVVELPVGANAVVLGAPGTGKTRAAVELVARRVLGDGFAPEEVLVLAPRRAQAARLRDRLVLRIGVPAAGPLARTAASLAFDIAKRSARAEHRPEPVLLTGGEQDTLIAQLLDGSPAPWPERLGPEARALPAFRAEVRDLLARLTEHALDPDALRSLGERHGRPEWTAVAAFADEYLDVVGAVHPNAFDSTELVALAAAAVDRGTAGVLADRLRLVVVDDLQDAAESTVALLAALAARGTAVVGLGDPDVAADTFRGGEPRLVGEFGQRLGLPGTERLVLTTVHRHPAALRSFVTAVTERIGTALAGAQRVAVAPSLAEADAIATVRSPTGADQALAIAHRIRERHLRHGVPFGEQAVVVRSGALAEPLARALVQAGVPASTAASGVPLAEQRAPRGLLEIVATGLGVRPLTPETAVDLLTGPFSGVDRLGLRRLRLALRAEELAGGGERNAGALLVEALGAPEWLVTVETPAGRRAARLAGWLQAVRERAASGAGAEELLWRVWESSGLAGPWRDRALGSGIGAEEAARDLDGLVALFAAAARSAERSPDEPAAVFVGDRLNERVPEDTLAPRGAREGVLVTTPAGVAGREFDTVVVAGLQEGVWPNLRPRGSLLSAGVLTRLVAAGEAPAGTLDDRRGVLSDELRLFALAVSRARRHLVLTAVVNEEEAASVLLDLADAQGAVRLTPGAPNALRPLVGELRRTVVAGAADARPAAAALRRLADAGVPGAHPRDWHGLAIPSTTRPLVPEEDAPVPVSPSAVESFEASQIDWFVERVAGREPRLANAVGTMLHWVLETAAEPDEAHLLAALEGRWRELDFEADWVGARERRLAERMIGAIARYLRDRDASGAVLLGGETPFAFPAGRAEVRGTIDRVEREPDGRITVVDLKTGRPSGHVSKAKAADHAQLGAYQLAVRAGAVPGVEPAAATSGARLLYVQSDTREPYKLIDQSALDDDAVVRFTERLAAAAEGMAGAAFSGPLEPEVRHGSSTLRSMLTRIPEVCGD